MTNHDTYNIFAENEILSKDHYSPRPEFKHYHLSKEEYEYFGKLIPEHKKHYLDLWFGRVETGTILVIHNLDDIELFFYGEVMNSCMYCGKAIRNDQESGSIKLPFAESFYHTKCHTQNEKEEKEND